MRRPRYWYCGTFLLLLLHNELLFFSPSIGSAVYFIAYESNSLAVVPSLLQGFFPYLKREKQSTREGFRAATVEKRSFILVLYDLSQEIFDDTS